MTTGIVKATPEMLVDIASRMRFEDRREIWCASRSTPTAALLKAYTSPYSVLCGVANDEPVCAFGCEPLGGFLSSTGTPWMLGTPSLSIHARRFLRGSLNVVEGWRERFNLLFNFVDARNDEAIKWLRWLGFDILDAEPYGVDALPFHRFEMRS